jgi:hypothetical protein
MNNEIKSPEGDRIKIMVENCWCHARSNEEMFYKVPLSKLRKLPDETELIYPNLRGYAIVPIEDFNVYMRAARKQKLSDRLHHIRSTFLRWFTKGLLSAISRGAN